ncbi:MAG: hydrogenase maturation nickel metallochaperone HypA [bacterium]
MHELSMATSILNTVLQEIETKKLPPVEYIVVRIGALSGILPDALEFSFDAIKRNTSLADTRLKIEKVPVTGKCRDCSAGFGVEDYVFACPRCNSGSIEVTHGQELDIAYLEVEEK